MPSYRLSPAAQADLEGIFDYTVYRWGLDRAVRYTQSIEAACSAIAANPGSTEDCDYIRAGYRRASAGRHTIYFRVDGGGVSVIRILHQRMDAPRHL